MKKIKLVGAIKKAIRAAYRNKKLKIDVKEDSSYPIPRTRYFLATCACDSGGFDEVRVGDELSMVFGVKPKIELHGPEHAPRQQIVFIFFDKAVVTCRPNQ